MRVEERVNGRMSRIFFETPKLNPSSVTVSSADVSPDQRWLLVSVSQSGSIDEHTLFVYDFLTAQLKWKLNDLSSDWVWYDNNRIVVYEYGTQSINRVVIDFSKTVGDLPEISSGKLKIIPFMNDENDEYFLGLDSNLNKPVLRHLQSGKTLAVDLPSYADSILLTDNRTFFLTTKSESANHLFLTNFYDKKVETREIQTELTRFEKMVKHTSGYLLYGYKGVHAALLNLDLVGNVVSQLVLPPGVSFGQIDVEAAKHSNVLHARLESHVSENVPVLLLLPNLQVLSSNSRLILTESEISDLAHFDGKTTWMTRTLSAISADGELIPFLVTHRKGVSLDGSLPTLIEVYGGFGLSIVQARYDRLNKALFMDHPGFKNGGVYVSPALRGGGEFGPSWHLAAVKENKIKTFQDLIAVTEKLHTLGITSPSRTVISGTSNGGYTVSAAAVLRPDLFGVVSTVNGVLDQVNKGILDQRFGGWSYEYGDIISDSFTIEKFLREMSPVHNQGRYGKPPKHIVVVGQSDGRVNPIHSYSMMEILSSFYPESNSVLVSLEQGGHWVQSITFQDIHGFRSSSRYWTELLGSLD